MAASTKITYNGITLDLVKTNRVARTPEYSPDGSEYLYTHWYLDFVTIYNPGATSYSGDAIPTPGFLPAQTDIAIRAALSQPREQLTIQIGADTWLSSPGVGLTCDANNGPKISDISIKKIINTNLFEVSFIIETWVTECGSDQPPMMISNRWQTIDQVDEQLLTTKITRGIAIFRTDLLQSALQSPDHFRNQALPPIQLGFKRVNTNVVMSPSLNALTYEVVDREQVTYIGDQHKSYGVTRWQGHYSQGTTSGEGGAASPMCNAEVSLQAWGERDTTNWQLTLFMIKMAYQKLQLVGGANPTPVLRNVQIRHALNDRYAEMIINVILPPSNQANNLSILNIAQLKNDSSIDLFVKDFTNPQPYDRGTRGSHKWEMLAQALRESCQKDPGYLQPIQSQSSDNPYVPGAGVNTIKVGVSDQFPYSTDNKYSSDYYHNYKIDVTYHTDEGIIHSFVGSPIVPPVYNSGSDSGGDQPTSPPVQATNTSNQTSSFQQIGNRKTTKYVVWELTKLGSQPILPNPKSYDPNLVLLDWKQQVAVPEPMPDGATILYSASGEYKYGLRQAMTPGAIAYTGRLPWATFNFTDGQYGNFSTDYLDPNSGGANSSGTQGTST